jgi:hypothetical protein
MKTLNLCKNVVVCLSLAIAASAFAANKGSLQVNNPVSVAGTKLAPGDYTLSWEGSGPTVQLSIMKGRKALLTTPAQVVNTETPTARDSALMKQNADGSRTLSEIRLAGKKYVLQIGSEAGGAQEGNSSKSEQ